MSAVAVPYRHFLSQGPVIAALSRVAFAAARAPASGGALVATPGPWIEERIPPRSEELVRDFVRWGGGDPASYRGVVPAHFFPQWGFPLAARTLMGLPYPLARVVNAGCRITRLAPLPAGVPLRVRARLESIDDDGRRAIFTQRVITGTDDVPEAIDAELRALVPLARGKAGEKPKRERHAVPQDAREIAFSRIPADAGLAFAALTGDVNPIHWLPPYARAAGFRACILHGFGTLARAVEALTRGVLAGDPSRLDTIDVRFVRPLVLPARVGVYVHGDGIWVGDAPGGAAYLEGRFSTTEIRS